MAHIYCNSSTQVAFEYIWEGFFKAIKTSTRRGIKFKVFNESGNILAIILNMEASQVKGLGSTIIHMKMNDPSISKISEVDPDLIVQFLIKLCCIHWERSEFGALISSKSHFFSSVLIAVFHSPPHCPLDSSRQ